MTSFPTPFQAIGRTIKSFRSALLGALLLPLLGFSQPWSYDFGTATGTQSSGASTSFFTSTPADGGTYRIRIGTAGGNLVLADPGTTLGTGTEAQLRAATSTSTNKFSVYDWADATAEGYVKFKLRTTSTTTGNLAFAFGRNTIGSDNNGYTGQYNNALGEFWITYDGSGSISSVNRRSTGSNAAITGSGFAKDADQEIEVYANNATAGASYHRNGSDHSLSGRSWDLWVDGVQVSPAGGWPRAGTLAADVALDGFAFYAESSMSNGAYMYIDDLEYDNALPTAPVTDPLIEATETALAFGPVLYGTSSTPQSVDVSGLNLSPADDELTVAVPADFEVSLDAGGPWTASVSLPYTGDALASTPVWVRFSPATTGVQTGNLTINGGSADEAAVALSGNGAATAPGTIYLHNFSTNPTSGQPYTVTPNTLDANLANSVWTNDIANVWSLVSGKLARGVNAGTHDYTLALDVAHGYLVEITGFSFWSRSATGNGPSDWSLAINGITVGNGTIPVTTGANTGTLNVGATRTDLAGPLTAVLTLTGASGNVSFELDDFELIGSVYPGTDPFLASTETVLPLFGAQVINTPSGTQSFSVSGMNLSPAAGDITVTAPAGTDFQVSTDASPAWASSVTLPYTGEALAATAVHVRFLPASLGLQSGDITITGGDADPLSVSVSGQGLEHTPSTIYLHNFGTGIINTHPYTVSPLATPVPGVLEAHLSNSSWTNSDGSWGQASGATGNGIRIFTSAAAETVSLSFDVATGYAVEISDFDFWIQRASAGQDWSMTIEGIAVGSGSLTGTSGNYIGQTPVANPVLVTDGQVNVVITWVNGTGNAGLTMDDFTLRGALIAQGTAVQFTSTSSTVGENAGTVNLTVGILEPDATNATTVDVVLVSGDAARIGGYTTQTVTFPAGSSADQTLTIPVTDNAACDGDAALQFELQNIAGGQGTPFIDLNNAYALTVTDNESPVDPVAIAGTDILGDGFTANWDAVNGATGYFLDVYAGAASVAEDFDDGDFTASPAWSGSTGSYTVLTAATLPNGSASTDGFFLGSNASVGSSALVMPSTEVQEWKFGLGSTSFSPAATNNFGVVLMADAPIASINDAFNGYYLNLGANGSADRIELWRSTGTTKTKVGDYTSGPSVSGAIPGGLNLRVTRTAAGEFELFHGSGFTYASTPATSAGTLTDNTYSASNYFGVFTDFANPAASRRVYIDNIVLGGAIEFIPGYENLPVAGTSQAVTGLDPLTTYYYRVRSEGGCSTGNNSNAIEVTTTTGVAPTLIAGELDDFGTLCLNATSAAQSFTVDGTNLTTADVTVGPLSGFSFSTTELGTYSASLSISQPGGTFSQAVWVTFTPTAVQAYDGNIPVGGGGATSIDVAVTGSGINTATVVGTGLASQSGDDQTEAEGSMNTDGCEAITAYGIEYSTTQGFTPGTGTQAASTNLAAGAFSSTLTGLALCTPYYYRAYATTAGGTVYGDEESFTNTDISAPVAMAATGVLTDGFTANWDAVTGATGYFLDVSTSPTFGTPLTATTVSTGFDNGRADLPAGWSHSGLGTDYGSDGGVATPSLKFDDTNDQLTSPVFPGAATSVSFWYKGQGTAGSASTLTTEGFDGSSWTTIGTLTAIASSATGTETYTLDASDGYVQFRFTYTKATGNLAFDDASVTYLLGTPDYLPGYENLPVTGTSQAVTGLDPNTTYYYRVRANSGCGASLNSNVENVTTLSAGCTDPLADNYDPGAASDDGSCTYCAPTITYNSPTPTPVVIGSGIPDQNMAVAQDCRGIDVGLSAFERYVGAIVPAGNVYTTTTGHSPTSGSDPTPDPVLARWNILGTVDLGSHDFTEVTVFLDADFDPGTTPVWESVNLSQLMIDNSLGNTSLYQASENPASAFWAALFPGAASFDPDVPGTYDLRVRLQSTYSGEDLGSLAIQVVVEAPEVTWYSQASGDVSDPIWDVVPAGTAGAATFGTNANMVVQNGHAVANTSATDVKDLTVETGGSLALATGSTLTVNGDEATIDGALTAADNSTLALAGADATVLESSGGTLDLWNLTVNTPAGSLTDAAINVRGTLQLDGGEFDASLGNVALASSATGTGRLGPVATGASYTGNITVQRYIPAGHTNWRMLASPVAGNTVANWQDDFFTAGYPGSAYPNFQSPVGSGILWPSVRWYNEANPFALADSGVTGVSSNTQPLAPGQGFLAWSGDNLTTTQAFTVDVTGAPTIAQAPLTLPMSYTSSGTLEADGWNLVGNPLPSPIDFNQVVRGGDVQNAYWIFDPVAGNNRAWTNGVGQGGLNGVIQSSQGFWLKADGGNLTTTVDESAKVDQAGGGTFGGDQDAALPILNFSIASGLNTYSDEATLVFAQGTPAHDPTDALKMTFKTIGAPQIGIMSSDGHQLAVDFFGSYASAVQIPLKVDVDVTGTYTITAAMAGINNLSCLSLTDLQTGTVTPLTDGASYSFAINADDDASTPRFVINGTAPLPFYNEAALCHDQAGTATVVLGEGPVDITWTDVFGNVLLQQNGLGGGTAAFEGLAGDYQVHVTPGGACGELAADFTITAPDAIGAEVLQTATLCPNSADGSITVIPSGGTAPYSFLWSNGGTTPGITGTTSGYTGIITDAAGCTSDSLFATIPAGEGTIAQFSTAGGILVVNTPVQFSNGSVLADSYLWDFGDGTTGTESDPAHTYTAPGTYSVTLTATGGDCTDSFTMAITVEMSTGIAPVEAAAGLSVRATADQLIIDHPFGNGPVDVDVYDATGRLALGRIGMVQPGRIAIGDRGLSTGVWFVRVTSGDVQRTFRVPLLR